MRRSIHRGFTLVELLVVIAIIGILVSLLLPAVQMAREAGRRSSCSNNLKQISLAFSTHEATHGWFPTGGWGYETVGDPDRGFGPEQPGGWAFVILPFVEQDNLFNMGKGLPDAQRMPKIAKRCEVPLALYVCPTRRRPQTYPDNHDYNCGVGRVTAAGRSDYACNLGTTTSSTSAGQGPSNYSDWDNSPPAPLKYNGISYQRSTVQAAHVTDGLSNTLCVAEKYVNPDFYFSGQDPGDNENFYIGYDTDIYRSMHRDRWPPMQDTPGLDRKDYFGGPHAGLWNIAMCDGSVHTLGLDIDQQVFLAIGGRNDKLPVSLGQ